MGAPHAKRLSRAESLVLTGIAYFQPIARGELSQLFGKQVSRDIIGQLRALNFIAAGPRSPQPDTPYTYVTTKQFLRTSASTLRPTRHRAARGDRSAQQTEAARRRGVSGESSSLDLMNIDEEGRESLATNELPLALSSEDL